MENTQHVPEGSDTPGISVSPSGEETREEGAAPAVHVSAAGHTTDEMAIGNEPRHRRGSVAQYFIPWALCWAVVVHTMTGVGLLFNAGDVRGVAVLVGLDLFVEIGFPSVALAASLLVASAMAGFGIYHEGTNHPSRAHVLALLLPQYFLVTSGLVNASFIIIAGQFHETPVTFWRGLIGLGPVMVMGLFHNLSILERYFLKWERRR